MVNRQQIRSFVLAGNALFTLKSLKTGKHFTFKVQLETMTGKPIKPHRWYVKVLNGPDNGRNYLWIGTIQEDNSAMNMLFRRRITKPNNPNVAPSVKGFYWFWGMLNSPALFAEERFTKQCLFHHAGRCGRCGRILTVPSSIESGIGPECQDKMAFEAMGGAEGLLDQLFGG